ncbi:MAG: M48 family metallopeptidase [Burkholderiaceae bacterium]|jgi:STE24 endopeptidase|nr:M48 family metallopeptidase [Burkholderiales bacterium]MCZ8101258.1 M48 family metallopeptidase [Burkholderiales bacterium]MCZ8339009.1 M48 family metallopeptidase [Burkholderiaceae bacterium]
MTPLTFTLAFAGALLASVGLRLWLASRQARHVARHRDAVPAQFAERIPLAAHQRAADYTLARTKLGLVETLVGAVVLVGFTVLGGIAAIADLLRAWLPEAPFLRQVLLVGTVAAIGGAVDLPLSWYRQFGLEKRFGFNRMTPRLLLADLAKGTLLALALGGPLLVAVLWLMERTGSLWWLWAWALWVAFNLAVLVLYPTVIAPMFNTFVPLEPGPVRERVERLLARCGFASKGLFVMDGSRRSAHGNAYFTGFGRGKRIVFFDTLLSRLNADEIEAVLAHELGHFTHRHIVKRIVASFAISLAGLWLLGWLSRQPWFYQGLGVTPQAGDALGGYALLLFFLAMPAFTFALQPLGSWLSRRHEFEADAFAARQSSAEDLSRALVKLYEDNAATLTPDPVHSAFYDSHPPAAIRLARLAALRGADGAAPQPAPA